MSVITKTENGRKVHYCAVTGKQLSRQAAYSRRRTEAYQLVKRMNALAMNANREHRIAV